jgi:hypothetical protein
VIKPQKRNNKIAVVGGPATGSEVVRPETDRLVFPAPGHGGSSEVIYTVRRCLDWNRKHVELLVPEGEAIDPFYLMAHGLTVEQ